MVFKSIKKIKQSLRLWLFSGNRITCPFCGYNARRLAWMGKDIEVIKEREIVGAGRRCAKCYNCGSTDRERLVLIYLKEEYKLFDRLKSLSILHIAPEEKISAQILEAGFSDYVCGDLFTEGYTYPQYVHDINILKIPFEENRFDLIICNHVLEHIIPDSRAIKELYRVLKIGGLAILQVPISNNMSKTFENDLVVNPREREQVFGQYDHVRIYGQDYEERLKTAGFSTERVNISSQYEHYGLNYKEDIFLGWKLNR